MEIYIVEVASDIHVYTYKLIDFQFCNNIYGFYYSVLLYIRKSPAQIDFIFISILTK